MDALENEDLGDQKEIETPSLDKPIVELIDEDASLEKMKV
jgi:hypothetical protein